MGDDASAVFGVSPSGQTIAIAESAGRATGGFLHLYDGAGVPLLTRHTIVGTPHDSPFAGFTDLEVLSPATIYVLLDHRDGPRVQQLAPNQTGIGTLGIHPIPGQPDSLATAGGRGMDIWVHDPVDDRSYPVFLLAGPVWDEQQQLAGARQGTPVGETWVRTKIEGATVDLEVRGPQAAWRARLSCPGGYEATQIVPLRLDAEGSLHLLVRFEAWIDGRREKVIAILVFDPAGVKRGQLTLDDDTFGPPPRFDVTDDGTVYGMWPGLDAIEVKRYTMPPYAAGGDSPPSFDEVFARSLEALETLGPTRVRAVQTTQIDLSGADVPPAQTDSVQTEEAELLLDVARKRARLTVRTSDRMVRTTVVDGNERVSTTSQLMGASEYVSFSRRVSLESPRGLPLPLWAGNVVSPTEGYPELFTGGERPYDDGDEVVTDRTLEQAPDGSATLSCRRTSTEGTAVITLLLGADLLPVRIDLRGRGTIEGTQIAYSLSIEYTYEDVGSFSAADFDLEVPADASTEEIAYELDVAHPWTDRALWEQYWLGGEVDGRPLHSAEYAVHEDDEAVFLLYDRPDASRANECIQLAVRPLTGRLAEDARKEGEQRWVLGSWTRRDMEVAQETATVYYGPADGVAGDPVDTIYVFTPYAFVMINVWTASVRLQEVFDALRQI
jgi:hypothetical protein